MVQQKETEFDKQKSLKEERKIEIEKYIKQRKEKLFAFKVKAENSTLVKRNEELKNEINLHKKKLEDLYKKNSLPLQELERKNSKLSETYENFSSHISVKQNSNYNFSFATCHCNTGYLVNLKIKSIWIRIIRCRSCEGTGNLDFKNTILDYKKYKSELKKIYKLPLSD